MQLNEAGAPGREQQAVPGGQVSDLLQGRPGGWGGEPGPGQEPGRGGPWFTLKMLIVINCCNAIN